MMPDVTVSPTPSGLPTARTTSPTLTASESPMTRVGRLVASILTTARSVAGSVPTTLAVNAWLTLSARHLRQLVAKEPAELLGDLLVGRDHRRALLDADRDHRGHDALDD